MDGVFYVMEECKNCLLEICEKIDDEIIGKEYELPTIRNQRGCIEDMIMDFEEALDSYGVTKRKDNIFKLLPLSYLSLYHLRDIIDAGCLDSRIDLPFITNNMGFVDDLICDFEENKKIVELAENEISLFLSMKNNIA